MKFKQFAKNMFDALDSAKADLQEIKEEEQKLKEMLKAIAQKKKDQFALIHKQKDEIKEARTKFNTQPIEKPVIERQPRGAISLEPTVS